MGGDDDRPGPQESTGPTLAEIARAYEYVLGGKDDTPVDDAAVAVVVEALVEGGLLARVNREWTIRVIRFLAVEAELTQFLDLGAGLPIGENTHEVIRHAGRSARVVYVDNDPVVVTHGQEILADDDRTWYVEGDLTDPAALWAHPVIQRHLDLTQPLGLLVSAALPHQPDELDLRGLMGQYVDVLAPGSYVALSHFCDPGGEDGAQLQRIRAILLEHGRDGERFRSRPDIAALLTGLTLLPSRPHNAEGLVPVGEWWPDGPTLIPPTPLETYLLGAVGYKP